MFNFIAGTIFGLILSLCLLALIAANLKYKHRNDGRYKSYYKHKPVYATNVIQDFKNIHHIFRKYSDAEEVVQSMREIMQSYGFVSVADVYELTAKPTEYTHRLYGWDNAIDIARAEILKINDGWVIHIADPKRL